MILEGKKMLTMEPELIGRRLFVVLLVAYRDSMSGLLKYVSLYVAHCIVHEPKLIVKPYIFFTLM